MKPHNNKQIWRLAEWLYINVPVWDGGFEDNRNEFYDMASNLLKAQANNEFTGADNHE